MHTCLHSWPICHHWQRYVIQKHTTWFWRWQPGQWYKLTFQNIIWAQYKDPLWRTTAEERLVHLKKVFATPGECGMLSERTKIWAHQASHCSHSVVTQMKILQQWHSQRSMHHVWSLSQAAFQSYCQEKVLPWWHQWKATKHRIPSAQTQEEAETPYNRGPLMNHLQRSKRQQKTIISPSLQCGIKQS